ncbi:MAG: hypothetical protein ABEH64_08590, partial [Salinirussus sp.]
GVAVAGDLTALRARHERLTIDRALAADANRSMRLRTIEATLSDLENRTAAIERDGRRARSAYLAGEIDRRALTRQLARVDARAEALESVRTTVEEAATGLNPRPDRTVTHTQNLEAALETIGGPATTRLRERYAGNRSGGATAVSVLGENGLVVATVADGILYREAFDAGERRIGGADTFSEAEEPEISVALRRAAEIYPWAFEHGSAAQPLRGYGNTSVYRITVEHSQGRLSTYLDGATGNVFAEVQRIVAAEVPVQRQRSETGNGLRLSLNATHSTGPMGVTVTREATGSPVDAVITIDETMVGRTGSDGRFWTVQPATGSMITARTDVNTTVSIELE